MPYMSVFWLRVATALYAVGLAHTFAVSLFRSSRLRPVALPTFRAGVLLHFVALVELAAALRHLPADNFFETVSLCGFLIALLFLFVLWRYKFESLSLAIFPLVFLMTLIGALEIPTASWSNPRVRDAWLLVHVMLVLIGYAGLLLAAIGSVFYLVQERRLKAKRSFALFEKLPPLGTLDKLISQSMALGFIFITLALIAGSIWAYVETGTRWITQPKIAVSLATWAFCLVMVYLRASAGWRGRRAAFLAIAVIGFSALTWAAHVGLRPIIAP
jgi:ABC-type uncharacterized transport system permease subunit